MHRHGLAIGIAAASFGAAMAVVVVAPTIWVALAALAAAGAADTVSGIFRGTMWNQTIPDELRGRLAGVELLSYWTGPAHTPSPSAPPGPLRLTLGVAKTRTRPARLGKTATANA